MKSNFTFKNAPTVQMMDWLFNGQSGTSSMTMLALHLGIPRNRTGTPGDEHDMIRCLQLVEQCPEVRQSFPELGATDEAWAKVLLDWDILKETYIRGGMRAMGDRLRVILDIPLPEKFTIK